MDKTLLELHEPIFLLVFATINHAHSPTIKGGPYRDFASREEIGQLLPQFFPVIPIYKRHIQVSGNIACQNYCQAMSEVGANIANTSSFGSPNSKRNRLT